VKEIEFAQAVSRGALLESIRDATHVLAGKDGEKTGA
jgi:hypothetical protein